ncbi:hypothetical protein ABI59_23685 [Acidobacteria bacterium Mor1]|nr:hypothetical protein ABI59_23685 [Acidobacteria bacterium Mor1]
MLCRDARRRLFERSLGTLSAKQQRSLDAHLAACAACAAEAKREQALSRAFEALRTEPDFEIDVQGAVMRQVRAEPRPARHDVSDRQLAWGLLTAAGGALALLAGAALLIPLLPAALRPLAPLGRGIGSAVRGMIASVAEWFAAPVNYITSLVEPLPDLVGQAQLSSLPVLLWGFALMAVTIVLVVGRDLVDPRRRHES